MNVIFVLLLILFAVFSRLIPHPPNFTPIVSVALFAGAYLQKRFAFTIPLLALFISDAIIGFYGPLMVFVYGSFALIALSGLVIKSNVSIGKIFWLSLAGSVSFFLITNFGVWMLGSMYPKTFAGLLECYMMAIPFFRNTLLSSVLYSGLLFGVYELAMKYAGVVKTAKI